MQQHAWTSVPHDYLHFLFHVWAVALDEAFAAGAFLLLEGALIQPHLCVLQKLGAFSAEFAVSSVFSFAVDVYHRLYGFLLSSDSRMFNSH
jgi:hypothetical protein